MLNAKRFIYSYAIDIEFSKYVSEDKIMENTAKPIMVIQQRHLLKKVNINS